MPRIGKNPQGKVVVEGSLNARYYDYFWAFHKISMSSESELIRDNWTKRYDAMSEADKKQIQRYLEKNPSPRMERENKQKCE